ncbi:MAG: hypothetical protein JWO77_1410 [Ilumatobacteraceae bacterium]|nr:hypothetical protein [Ilumatobacteraceae bacterium]
MFHPHEGANPYARPTVPASLPGPAPRSRQSRGQIPAAVLLAAVLIVAGLVAFLLIRPDQADGPGETVQAFVRAAYSEDSDAVCGSLAASNIERFEETGTTCADAMDQIFAEIDPEEADTTALFPLGDAGAPKVKIVKVDIVGDRAEVQARIDGELTDEPVIVIKQDGRWKLDLDAGEACDREQRTLRIAAEAYEAQYSKTAADADVLVDKGFLLEVPPHARLSDGDVTMTGDCA